MLQCVLLQCTCCTMRSTLPWVFLHALIVAHRMMQVSLSHTHTHIQSRSLSLSLSLSLFLYFPSLSFALFLSLSLSLFLQALVAAHSVTRESIQRSWQRLLVLTATLARCVCLADCCNLLQSLYVLQSVAVYCGPPTRDLIVALARCECVAVCCSLCVAVCCGLPTPVSTASLAWCVCVTVCMCVAVCTCVAVCCSLPRAINACVKYRTDSVCVCVCACVCVRARSCAQTCVLERQRVYI